MNKHIGQSNRMMASEATPGETSSFAAVTPEWLSALKDGEALSAEIDAGLDAFMKDEMTVSSWHAYHVIGDVIRDGNQAMAGSMSSVALLAAVRQGIQAAPAEGLASSTIQVVAPPQRDSANDPAFAWKMVAGFASVAAVVAISWASLGAGQSSESTAMPVLAGNTAPATGIIPVSTDGPATVVVNTVQGPMLRDPELEKLLAEHRHFGGASSLQMPTGFLRSATQEAVGRP